MTCASDRSLDSTTLHFIQFHTEPNISAWFHQWGAVGLAAVRLSCALGWGDRFATKLQLVEAIISDVEVREDHIKNCDDYVLKKRRLRFMR